MDRPKREKFLPKKLCDNIKDSKERFQCSYCKSNYARKAGLNTHVKQKHEHVMKCSDDGDENINFIPPKPKIANLNKVVNPIDPNEVPNAGTLVDRGTPNEGVGNFNTISSGMI